MGCKHVWLSALLLTGVATTLAVGAANNDPPASAESAATAAASVCPAQSATQPRRRRPQHAGEAFEPTPCNPDALPPPQTPAASAEGLPDRWRVVSMLGYGENLLDPYHGNNWLKGDRPAFGDDWFVNLVGISDTLFEPRRFPLPVGGPVSARAGSLDTFGEGAQIGRASCRERV